MDIEQQLVLPDIDQTLLVLMGLGSAAYIGTKLVPSTAVQLISLNVAALEPGEDLVVNGQRLGTSGLVQIGDAIVQSGLVWTDTAVTVTIPPKKPDNTDWQFGTPVDVVVFGSNGKSVNALPVTINKP
jgi:hypothetical protein